MKKDKKICASCGRSFEFQKRWAKTWDSVMYCSNSCKKDRYDRKDVEFEEYILKRLAAQEGNNSLCPSFLAREYFSENWRDQMERTRRACRRLAHRNLILITQKTKVVDPTEIKGPIRVRLAPV